MGRAIAPEAYISLDGILLNNRFYWFADGRPNRVRYLVGKPSWRFKWQTRGKPPHVTKHQLKVPVPRGREADADQVLEHFAFQK